MNEALLGYAEAAFLCLSVLTLSIILVRTFAPSQRGAMNDHAMIPFREGDDGRS